MLLVVSNHGELGDTGHKTGVWMAELTHPYWKLADSGQKMTLELASPAGGDAPIDSFSSEQTARWIGSENVTVQNPDGTPREAVEYRFTQTLRLRDITPEDYDAIYFAGGNGAMWQFPESQDVHRAVREFYESGKIVSAACHGTSALLNTKLSDGPLGQAPDRRDVVRP